MSDVGNGDNGPGRAAGPSSSRDFRVIQFGAFELRADTGELRKHGIRLRLQTKPLRLLRALLEHPGEVVTREEMRSYLWPADTFVDFESGLNTAANRLRIVLGDSADAPRFIETLPRVGYRFIAPVQEIAVTRPTTAIPPTQRPVHAAPPQPATLPPAMAPEAAPLAADEPRAAGQRTRGKTLLGAAAGLALVAGLATWVSAARSTHDLRSPEFHRISFEAGSVSSARFAPDGSTVVYSRWNAGQLQIYVGAALSPEARSLNIRDALLAGVSRSGELAIIYRSPSELNGVLMRVPMTGEGRREIARRVIDADWAPDGENLAVSRLDDSGSVIEYPAGRVIWKLSGWASYVRVSPSGRRVAILEHPKWDDDAGSLRVIDRDGASRVISSGWASMQGLAWAPDEKEIWFTASEHGLQRSLHAATLDGRTRTVSTIPGALRLLDISPLGHVLLCREDDRMSMAGMFAGAAKPEEVPGFDYSAVNGISTDGNLVLFTESGDAGAAGYSIYVYDRATHTNTRLGRGQALGIAPDGKSVLALDMHDQASLLLIPVGAGQEKRISGGGLRYQSAAFFPSGKQLLVVGAYPGQPARLFVQGIDGQAPQALQTTACLRFPSVSPDGRSVLGFESERAVVLSLDNLRFRELPMPLGELRPVAWADGQSMILSTWHGPRWKLIRANADGSAARELGSFTPQESSGQLWLSGVVATPDGASWVYSWARNVSQLYEADGWLTGR